MIDGVSHMSAYAFLKNWPIIVEAVDIIMYNRRNGGEKHITMTKIKTILWKHRDWELLIGIIFTCLCGSVHKVLVAINAFLFLFFPGPLSAFSA